jgi:hypothetical protein
MRHSRLALSIAILFVIALVTSTAFSVQAVAAPTSATQTLMSRLSPENSTVGQTISWTTWMDPSVQGQPMTLTITDLGNITVSNNTVIYNTNINMPSGVYSQSVNTAGYKHHVYEFMANTTYGNMKLQSIRYNSFVPTVSNLFVFASAEPATAIPGDTLSLTIEDFNSATYQPVAATLNITLTNSTSPSPINSWKNVAIPSSNGTRILRVSTTGLKANTLGNYYKFNINATSAIGKATSLAVFTLKDIIVTVQNSSYFIGDPLNVSIRTYPTVSQAGLTIFSESFTTTPPYFQIVKVVDQYVSLTNGKATVFPSSTTWKPESYQALGNATVSSLTAEDTDYFSLYAFLVNVGTNKDEYLSGQTVNVTTTTTPKKGGASFTLTVTNSTDDTIWTYGPSTLRSDGTAVNLITTTNNWPVDTYTVKASVTSTVQGTQYVINDTSNFDIIKRTFNIYATLSSLTYSGYVMPLLNITTVAGQTNANLTITIQGPYLYYTGTAGEEYLFTKTQSDFTQYLYNLPLPIGPNGTRYILVQVDSSAGTNKTYAYLTYTHTNEVVVSEPFLLQTLLLLGSSPLFYIAIRKRREPAVPQK